MPYAKWILPFVVVTTLAAVPASAQKAPEVRVVVDPRVELMSVIFRLAGNREYNQGKVDAYTKAVEARFGPHRDHPVVQYARGLRRRRGVSYDACMAMAIHVTNAAELKPVVPLEPWPAGIDRRWTPQAAREFLKRARAFVEETKFPAFIDQQEPLYGTAISRMKKVLERDAHLEWFESFFGVRPGAPFTLALGMLNGGGCYGAKVVHPDGTESLYCVLGVWSTDGDGMPQFDRSMLPTVVHEFCHSYCNPLVDQHAAALEKAGMAMFPFVADQMRRQAYSNWKTMMYESLVRACVARYGLAHGGERNARKILRSDRRRGFLWIEELYDVLGEYEKDRERYATLGAFFPRVIAFFKDHAPKFAAEQQEMGAKRPRVVSMTPVNGATDVDPGLNVIKIVFDRPMRDKSWAVVGGGPNFPKLNGAPSYDKDCKVLTLQVTLKPAWRYEFWLNRGRYQSFVSQDGHRLKSVHVRFKTK